MSRIKKKKIPVHEGRVGVLPPLSIVIDSEAPSVVEAGGAKTVSAIEERATGGDKLAEDEKTFGSAITAKKSIDPAAA